MCCVGCRLATCNERDGLQHEQMSEHPEQAEHVQRGDQWSRCANAPLTEPTGPVTLDGDSERVPGLGIRGSGSLPLGNSPTSAIAPEIEHLAREGDGIVNSFHCSPRNAGDLVVVEDKRGFRFSEKRWRVRA